MSAFFSAGVGMRALSHGLRAGLSSNRGSLNPSDAQGHQTELQLRCVM
jgi:hypothetical protein